MRNPCQRCGSLFPRRTITGPLGLFFLALRLSAQSLQILPAPSHDGSNTFRIMIVSPPENPVLALQWRVAVSKGAAIAPNGIQAGAAAAAATKELTCRAVESAGREASAYVCILAGGRRPIPDGPVAVVRLVARDRDSSVVVRLSGMKAVTIDTKASTIPDVDAEVRVPARREEK